MEIYCKSCTATFPEAEAVKKDNSLFCPYCDASVSLNADDNSENEDEILSGEDISAYKCPACSQTLAFDAESGKLSCSSCGNKYAVSAMRRLNTSDSRSGFSWSDYLTEFENGREKLNGAVYICKFCGADVETDGVTAATRCPFCDNNLILSDRVSGSVKPDYVIPFSVVRENFSQKFRETLKKKKLLPGDFFEKAQLDAIQGAYIPFWLFDANVDGGASFNSHSTTTWSDSRYIYTNTRYYLIEADGSVDFKKVPADASSRADDNLTTALEPYDYSALVPFEEGYLSGYVATRFDVTPDQCANRVQERMVKTTVDLMQNRLQNSYPNVSFRSSSLYAKKAGLKYALLPAYILNFKYDNKNYCVAMNGQTGKIVGTLPIDKKKKWLLFLRNAGIIAACAFLIAFIIITFSNGGFAFWLGK